MTNQDVIHPGTASFASSDPGAMATGSGKAVEFNVAAHGLRGLASIMVLVAHVIGGTARHIYPANALYVSAIQHPWNFGVFGVKIFFMISGFVIIPSALKYTAREFALRRFFRIYPLFLVASLLFIFLNFETNLYPDVNNIESIVPALLFMNLFTGTEQLTPNAWSLSYEVVFYALTCASVYVFVKNPRPIAAILVMVAAVAFLVEFPVALFFIFGIVVRISGHRLVIQKGVLRLTEGCLFLGLVYTASQGFFEYRIEDLTEPVAMSAMLFAVAYFWLAVDRRSLSSAIFDNRAFVYLGTISYSIYIVHPYVYFVIRAIFVKIEMFTDNAWLSVSFFGVMVAVISIAASHISYMMLEQWPYRWFFRQRLYFDPQPKIA